MGRTYAGILGLIAFGAIVARHLVQGGNVESAVTAAIVALFVFAALGYFIGFIAERTVIEAIETRFRADWQAGGPARSAIRTTEPRPSQDDPAA